MDNMIDIYKEGENCWRTNKADCASLLVDYANFYKALYHAIDNAKHSVFIVGWDINSHIQLVRDEHDKHKYYKDKDKTLFSLICRKARENPEMQFYLNCWNYSVFFINDRDFMSEWRWRFFAPDNVHYISDNKVPFYGSHHQKVVVIDDELAFCGGMDVAVGRWDNRNHHVQMAKRYDPGGIFEFFKKRFYTPYHDVHMMYTGPVVQDFAELVRDRWFKASNIDAIPFHGKDGDGHVWPEYISCDFNNVDVAISRTLPETPEYDTKDEILQAYLTEIGKAENFIYVENQYLTCLDIARALNKQLKEQPNLRVLMVNGTRPRGMVEKIAILQSRIKFHRLVGEGVDPSRYAIGCPYTLEKKKRMNIHVHSKLMVVDNKIFHCGSANWSERSMGVDSECDVTIIAKDEPTSHQMRLLTADLIHEHTGVKVEDILNVIDTPGKSLNTILQYQNDSRQHLDILPEPDPSGKDEKETIMFKLAQYCGDKRYANIIYNIPARHILSLIFVVALLAVPIVLGAQWIGHNWTPEFSFEEILTTAKTSVWAPLIIIGLYLLAGLIFFPVTIMNFTVAVIYGAKLGVFYAFMGSLSSAAAFYFIGYFFHRWLGNKLRSMTEKIKSYTDRGGIMGMTAIRLIPIAPFTLVNISFGLARLAFIPYMFATFFGLAPGILAKGVLGGTIAELWENPTPKVIAYTIGAFLLWGLIIWGSHRAFKVLKARMNND